MKQGNYVLFMNNSLAPPKSPLTGYELVLLKEANKNPYLNSLINMLLATHKTSSSEQKSLLLEALSNVLFLN